MANFPPLKKYILYCVDSLIERYKLSPPFLDIGCGIGDISQHVALRGWHGKAIDSSDIAIEKAKRNLANFKNIEVEKRSLSEEKRVFNTIFLMDTLEHIENDKAALEKITSILSPGGHLVISVPSNPGEWRWDDEVYGHYRRYTVEEIEEKLVAATLTPLLVWDFTYPFFWIMRRIYTKLKIFPETSKLDKRLRTEVSSSTNAWDMLFLSEFLSQRYFFWSLIYKIQFTYFKDKPERGHEMMVLARNRSAS